MNRSILVVFVSLTAFAARPPARQHASPEVIAGVDDLTPGARFLATLPTATREAVRKDGQAVLDNKPGVDRSEERRVGKECA